MVSKRIRGPSPSPWGWDVWRSREGGLRLGSAIQDLNVVKKEGRLFLPSGQGSLETCLILGQEVTVGKREFPAERTAGAPTVCQATS